MGMWAVTHGGVQTRLGVLTGTTDGSPPTRTPNSLLRMHTPARSARGNRYGHARARKRVRTHIPPRGQGASEPADGSVPPLAEAPRTLRVGSSWGAPHEAELAQRTRENRYGRECLRNRERTHIPPRGQGAPEPVVGSVAPLAEAPQATRVGNARETPRGIEWTGGETVRRRAWAATWRAAPVRRKAGLDVLRRGGGPTWVAWRGACPAHPPVGGSLRRVRPAGPGMGASCLATGAWRAIRLG